MELARRWLASGALAPADLRTQLARHAESGASLVGLLLDSGAVASRALDEELERTEGPARDRLEPVSALFEGLPRGMCRSLRAVPAAILPNGEVEVAVLDPLDEHVRREFAYQLGVMVRLVRARPEALEIALAACEARLARNTEPARHSEPRAEPRPPLEGPSGATAAPGEGELEDEPRETLRPGMLQPVLGDLAANAERSAPRTPRAPGLSGGPSQGVELLDLYLDALVLARDRDEIVENVVAGLGTVAGHAAAFAVRRDSFRGAACSPGLANAEQFRRLTLPLGEPSVLGIALARGSYLGPLPETPVHEPLRAMLGAAGDEVLTVLVRVREHPVLVLLAAELVQRDLASSRAAKIGRAASDAFGRILYQKKIARSPSSE